jgi:4-amino-4-deoxy-L-arabinose transferase-like glycosyltransferase
MPSITRVVDQITFGPTRLQVLVLIALIWVGIYLPGLGSVELKHEEPRRALPAVHMLASGDWLVPRVGSIPFLRKPPMLQWLIASSFLITGTKSEWAVRLPSALATLALALAIGSIGANWLGTKGSLLAAVLFLTNFAILETGRLAELEAVYVGSTGIGLLIWAAEWLRGERGWRLWLLPAVFLSIAMLTKGPTHLIFFYGVVISTLAFAKDLRLLVHPAHWSALALMVGLFTAWALPCSLAVGQHNPMGVWEFWIHQISSRASASEAQHFHLAAWLLRFPMTLKNFLPWTPLLLFLWPREADKPTDVGSETKGVAMARKQAWFHGARLGMVVTSLVMSLLPNGSPRYLYPLFVVPCLLLAQVLAVDRQDAFRKKTLNLWKVANTFLLGLAVAAILSVPFLAGLNLVTFCGLFCCALILVLAFIACRSSSQDSPASVRVLRQALTTAAILMVAMLFYAMAIVPRANSMSYGAREAAVAIRSKLPDATTLWVHEGEYRPFWYYLEPDVKYFLKPNDISSDARYFILPKDEAGRFMQNPRWAGSHFDTLSQVVDSEQKTFTILRKEAEPIANSR